MDGEVRCRVGRNVFHDREPQQCAAARAVIGADRQLQALATEFLDVAGFSEVPWPTDGMIQPEDIAELALTCVALPRNVQLDTMVIWPTCQAT